MQCTLARVDLAALKALGCPVIFSTRMLAAILMWLCSSSYQCDLGRRRAYMKSSSNLGKNYTEIS